VDVALHAAKHVAGGARHLRQAFGADDDQRHHPNHKEFKEADIEHGPAAFQGPAFKKMPGGPGIVRGSIVVPDAGGQTLLLLSFFTSASMVCPVTCCGGVSLASSERMPSLKPFTAPPRSAPMLRSFLVPNTSMTISRTINQCQMLNVPIVVLL